MNRQELGQSLNLIEELIAAGRPNRPGSPIAPRFVTIHNTSNTGSKADARAHSRFVRNTGFYSGPVDGILGPASRKAIKEYQVLHELAPDGVVGPKTWSSLRLYLDSPE